MDKEKEKYELITENELETPSMPDSTYVGQDKTYLYYICGSRKVKILK